MNWIFTLLAGLSVLAALMSGKGQALSSAVLEGARAGLDLSMTLAGPLILWSGIGKLMDKAGITAWIAERLRPFLSTLFPESRKDPILAGHLSANFCANLLGLGNAATPRGIQAALRLQNGTRASDSFCRLVVLNTASIQLIPTSVAAIRSGLGAVHPFDILPAVWITSFLSAGLGLAAAEILRKLWKDD